MLLMITSEGNKRVFLLMFWRMTKLKSGGSNQLGLFNWCYNNKYVK